MDDPSKLEVGIVKQGKIRSLLKPSKKNLLLLGIVILIVGTGIGLVFNGKGTTRQRDKAVTEDIRSQGIINTKEPSGIADKIAYYSTMGDIYETHKDFKKALDAYLKADSYIRQGNFSDQSANVAIARSYEALGNKSKAREYYQREIDRLSGTPDNQEVIEYLKKQKDAV
jgi:hypothetical protein